MTSASDRIYLEYRPRPMKDSLEACYAAGWDNPESFTPVPCRAETDEELRDLRSPARARMKRRIGDGASYVAGVGVVADAEQLAKEACRCLGSEVMNWMFLRPDHTASLTRFNETTGETVYLTSTPLQLPPS